MKKWTWWVLGALLLLVAGCSDEAKEVPGGNGDELESGPVALVEKEMSAKVVGGSLEVYFPLSNNGDAVLDGSVDITCRHLGGEFSVSGSAEFELESGKNPDIAVHLDEAPPFETMSEQAEYVVEYKVKADGYQIKGTRSLFMLLDKSDLILMVPEKLYAGQKSLLKAFLIDPRTGAALSNKKIRLELIAADGTRTTMEETTDAKGAALFESDEDDPQDLTAKAAVIGGNGETVETNVAVVRESRLLLTSDKPMYQPGQTMHLRALGLDRFDLKPLSGEHVLFEVMDSKGNKVFKQEGASNEFGVAWAEFKLGAQVLMGPYTLRVTIGDVASEKTVSVDRYSLPKFKVAVDVDKSFYMPGQTVSGTVQADYFFGKPVEDGTVSIVPYKYEAEWVPMETIQGVTNDSGLYAFSFKLPNYLVGQPIEGGKAMVMVEFSVTDTASHEQKVAKNLIVTDKVMDVVAIPESGEVVPDVSNLFYLFVTDPNGNPVGATCKLTVNGAELDEEGDEVAVPTSGPAVVSLTPHQGTLDLVVVAKNDQGDSATATFNFSVGSAQAGILLRTDKALYKVGESMVISAFVANAYDTVFLDVVRKNQTVLTKSLEVVDGEAALTVDLDGALTEDLMVDAYILADNGQFIRDTRVVFVQPATDLDIAVKADKDEYLPGESAKIEFTVTDGDKKPVQSALGLQVVDEAVFALSEVKPGLLELYFRLEDELANPTYQIGKGLGLSLGGLMAAEANAEPGSEEDKAVQDTTAAAFAAMGGLTPGQQRISSWADALKGIPEVVNPFYDTRKAEVLDRLGLLLAVDQTDWYDACPILADYLSKPREWDFWGNPFTFTVAGDDWSCSVTMKSRGPDEMENSGDDWSTTFDLYALSGKGQWKGGGGWMEGDGDFANEPTAGAMDAGAVEEEPPAEPEPGEEGGGKASVKVRSWFPETLFVLPSLITGEDGKASVEFPLADSITEWRMTTLASSMAGHLGSRDDGIVVFQDFFVDIDFPKYLTQNDELKFPVAVYNYLPEQQTVSIEVTEDDWFDLLADPVQELTLEAGEVSVVFFPVKVTKVGWHSLLVYGLGAKEAKDAIKRTVEVKPDGKEIVDTTSARFKNDGKTTSTDQVQLVAEFPDNSIEGARFVVVKILPGLSTHIVEGMESMLQLPGG